MARASKNKSQAEKEIEEMVQEAVREAQDEEGDEGAQSIEEVLEEAGVDLDEAPSEGEIASLIERGKREAAFDIFQDLGAKLLASGIPVVYHIKKHGEHLVTVPHQQLSSWDQLRAKYGPGQYTVQARHGIKKTFLKQQTNVLGDYEEESPVEVPQPRTPVSSGNSTNELLTIIMQMNEQSARRAEEQRRADQERADRQMQMMMQITSESSKTLVTALTAMLGNKSSEAHASKGDDKFMEFMFNFMQQSVQKQQDMMERFMEKVEEKLGRNVTQRSKLDDPMALLQLITSAEERGVAKMTMIREMAREMAEEMAEKGGSSEGEEKSMLDKLITSVAPLAAQAIAKGPGPMGIPGGMMPPPRAPARPVIPARQAAPLRPAQSAPLVRSKVRTLEERRLLQAKAREVRSLHTAPMLSRPVVSQPAHDPTIQGHPADSRGHGQETLISTDGGTDLMNPSTPSPQGNREKLLGVMTEALPKWLLARKDPKEAARETITVLMHAGLTVEDALTEFPTKESLLSEAHAQGLPKMADSWLNQYHANLEALSHQSRQASGS